MDMPVIGATFDRVEALFDRRFVTRPSWVVLAELFLGIGWARSLVAKVGEPDWWTGRTLVDFVAEHQTHTVAWYQPILDGVIVDYAAWWAAVVLVTELVIAVALLTSVRIGAGLAAAIFLNVNFLLIGAANPSIFYLVLQLGLVLWRLEAGTAPQVAVRWLRTLTVGGLLLAVLCLPFVRTLDPAMVIEDPASVLTTWALCGSVATAVARRRVRRKLLSVSVIDARAPAMALARD